MFLFLSTFLYGQKDMPIDIVSGFDSTDQRYTDQILSNTKKDLYIRKVGKDFNFRTFENDIGKTDLRYTNLGDNSLSNDDSRSWFGIGPRIGRTDGRDDYGKK